MFRALILTTLLLLGVPAARLPRVSPFQKQSGWISTCDGIGCHGRRTECATYNTRNGDGSVTSHFCYEDGY